MGRLGKYFPWFLFVTFFVFQLIFIGADTPSFFTTDSGTYCDEGYKTLDARNLTLYGTSRWCEYDEYPGWTGGSPITVAANYLMFRLFGVSIQTARLCNVIFAVGTLSVLYLFLTSVYDKRVSFLVVVVCMLNSVWFFYSRVALFEMKMLFFICCALWLLERSKRNKVFIILAVASCVAAFLCKATAMVFIISLCAYYAVTCGNGYVIKKLAKPKVLLLLVIVAAIFVISVEYSFEYFHHFKLMGRDFRSPTEAFFALPPPEFFKKAPVLIALSIIYIGYLLTRLIDQQEYRNQDILFAIWFLLGTIFHSFLTYRPLRYYVVFVVPMSVLAVRAVFGLPDLYKMVLLRKHMWLVGAILVFSGSFLIVFGGSAFLSMFPAFHNMVDYGKAHMVSIGLGVTGILTAFYVVTIRRGRGVEMGSSPIFSKTMFASICLMVCGTQVYPILSWAINPKYELVDAFARIEEISGKRSVVGDWAPQLCINTSCRVLYSDFGNDNPKRYLNFRNLDKVKPDFLVLVDGMNNGYREEFQDTYPGVMQPVPVLRLTYAGQSISMYKLAF